MRFAKLRLHGFKSFVEPTELLIQPGLTGIVGPNGCGKSNLVEALRWVMGETSAKRMRGGEMEDVIFGGTANRPARNVAEVQLAVENDTLSAPPPFNDTAELDVSRRIERGAGSDYRINGKAVRARDVQILFADHAIGANSPALVSQGKVGAIINAKPTQRRDILEEAAGISGLHARRHETELRLKAAESNLERVEDVLGTMETQLGNLKRQARQAARYRTISDRIRKAEALLLHRKWIEAEDGLKRARETFAATETRVRELLAEVASASTAQAEFAAALPPLRDAAAATNARVQRLRIEAEQLAEEAKRIENQQRAAEQRLKQIRQDQERAAGLLADARHALARLDAERQEIEAAQTGEAAREAETAKAADEAQALVQQLDTRVASLTRETAMQETAQRNLQQRMADLDQRRGRLEREQGKLGEKLGRVEAGLLPTAELAALEQAVTAAETSQQLATASHEQAETTVQQREQQQTAARQVLQEAQHALSRLKAETEALRHLTRESKTRSGGQPVLGEIVTDDGFETALAAALGVALDASTEASDSFFWRTDGQQISGDLSDCPTDSAPLSAHVQVPPALARALTGIGVVADRATGDRLADTLRPGQLLVTKAGESWRWDGYVCRRPHAEDAAAKLQQRNRLRQLEGELAQAEAATETARTAAVATEQALTAAREAEKQARQQVRDAFAATGAARTALTQQTQAQAKSASEAAGLRERLTAQQQELQSLAEQRHQAEAELAAMPSLDEAMQVLDDYRGQLEDARRQAGERHQLVDRVRREIHGRRRRLEAIAADQQSWQSRMDGSDTHNRELAERASALDAELTALKDQPQSLATREQGLLDTLAEAEREAKRQADALIDAERSLEQVERRLRQVEGHSADSREARARAEAAVEMARQTVTALTEEIRERLEATPDQVPALSEHDPEKPLPPLDELQRAVDRLRRERETLGAVNLRAEQEAETLQQEIDTLTAERDDLVSAIGRLRQGIGKLKSEARTRLLDAFAKVDQAFQQLFVTLFGGGRAQLSLTEAEDPLDAGLEIFASPPGKRLQNLSLLSGGEQALTAVALLFAVFQTNPSPICVLDEVDAPLDEANVDRFCTMLEHMSQTDTTRFLVITHHQLTMARMHRLFGVTMGERGVSQLVAVDLEGGIRLREAG